MVLCDFFFFLLLLCFPLFECKKKERRGNDDAFRRRQPVASGISPIVDVTVARRFSPTAHRSAAMHTASHNISPPHPLLPTRDMECGAKRRCFALLRKPRFPPPSVEFMGATSKPTDGRVGSSGATSVWFGPENCVFVFFFLFY